MTTFRAAETSGANLALRLWLLAVALMIAATAIVGAATRLTGSGLSITEWQPIIGILPPLSEAAWTEAFAKYQAIPQYQRVNAGMSLPAFQTIYWWEWSHRLIARAIGVVFLLPFLTFLVRGRIPARLVPRLALMFALGGLQGAIGWYMVSSGLADRVDVSPYRLALHLGVAVLILGLLLRTILDLAPDDGGIHLATVTGRQRLTARLLLGLVYIQVLLGALVAGLKAGRTYNTWPLMDGVLIPGGLGQLKPFWLNLFENAATVQFNHRIAAYLIAILAVAHAVSIGRTADDERVRHSAGLLAAAIFAQAALGVWTLLASVPIGLGLAHQAGALALFAVAIWHLWSLTRATRAATMR